MDIDLNAPAVVAPDTRGTYVGGASPAEIVVAVDSPVRPPRMQGGAPGRLVPRPPADVPALLPRARNEVPLADNQLYAAAELVRRGLARQVIMANAAVDAALPDDWQIRGTAIHLERLADGRTRVTAGPARA